MLYIFCCRTSTGEAGDKQVLVGDTATYRVSHDMASSVETDTGSNVERGRAASVQQTLANSMYDPHLAPQMVSVIIVMSVLL